MESFGEDQQQAKKHNISFTSASSNPYRTLPKDAPVRGKDGQRNPDNRSSGGGFNSPGGMGNNPNQGSMNFGMNNFRGGRGGFSNRGNPMNNMGGFPNRSFSGPMGGASPGAFQGAPMAGFPGANMGGMPPYGGFPNRGGMMGGMRGGPVGNRGGRGAMGPNGMGMPAMGGMGAMMGGMPGPMGGIGAGMGAGMNMGPMAMQGMNGLHNSSMMGGFSAPMMGEYLRRVNVTCVGAASVTPFVGTFWFPYSPAFPIGSPIFFAPPTVAWNGTLNHGFGWTLGQGGFQGPQPHFNPAFFNQNQAAGGDGNWNPHGTKRQRPE